jgi:4-amino-4-deoxy-L-arabinose transferase-like glycosyltransferase
MINRALANRAVVVAAALGGSAAMLAARWPLLFARRFDPDEFEHAHVAWSILHGQVPYKDFFEHHAPLFHYLLAGLLSIAGVDRSADAGLGALFTARIVTWTFSVLIVVLTWMLARRLWDVITAWVAAAIVAGNFVVALRAIEIRPDGLATMLWLAALIATHRAITSGTPAAAATRRMFLIAGLCIGLAVLTSQKLLIAGPSLAFILAWYCAGARFGGTRAARVTNGAWQVAGVLAPWLVTLALFAAQGGGGAFVQGVLLQNLAWKRELTAGNTLGLLTAYNPWFLALAAGGALVLFSRRRRQDPDWPSAVFLLVNAAVPFAGLFLTPVPFPQYCLTFIPLFAILGAHFVVGVARGEAHIVAIVVAAGLAALGLATARPFVLHPLVYPALVVAALVAAATARWHRRPAVVLVLVLVMLSAQPAQWTRWMLSTGDQGQFAGLRSVLAMPRETVVMDGWTGYGVFRPHAWYYWMLHPGVRAMLPAAAVNELMADLGSGRLQPGVILFDSQIRALAPAMAGYVEQHYVPTGVSPIYVRRER